MYIGLWGILKVVLVIKMFSFIKFNRWIFKVNLCIIRGHSLKSPITDIHDDGGHLLIFVLPTRQDGLHVLTLKKCSFLEMSGL